MTCAHHKYGICALGKALPEDLPGACGSCAFRTVRPSNPAPRPQEAPPAGEGRVRKVCVPCQEKRAALNEATMRRIRDGG